MQQGGRMKKLFTTTILFIVFLAACSTQTGELEESQDTGSEQIATQTVYDLIAYETGDFPLGRFVSANESSIAVEYLEDGTYYFYYGSKNPVITGKFASISDQITVLNPEDTDPNCIGTADYKWSFDGKQLTFKPTAEDKCRGRSEAHADTYIMDSASMPEITIEAADFSFTAPDSVSEGWVRVKLINSGSEPHHVQFMRMKDGVTFEQFQEALSQGEGPALALVEQVGGVGAVHPAGSAQAVLNLTPGEYIMMCFIPSVSDGMHHFMKGMIETMTVDNDVTLALDEPTATMTVRLKDYRFEMPDTLPSGQSTIKVINDGPESHEFNILKLEEGKTLADVTAFLNGEVEGPPPFIPVGGMNGLDAGLTGYIEFDFQPGTYIAICNIPSPKADGHPHSTLGMIKEFTIGTNGS